jgi:hypothetical protein
MSDQRQSYGKLKSTGKLQGAQSSLKTGENGPTGSPRHYPKGKGGSSPHNTAWNPAKMKGSTYGIGGV